MHVLSTGEQSEERDVHRLECDSHCRIPGRQIFRVRQEAPAEDTQAGRHKQEADEHKGDMDRP